MKGLFLDYHSVPLIFMPILCQYKTVVGYSNFVVSYISPPTLFFFLKIVLVITGPLHFHMNLKINLSILAKQEAGILVSVLNLQINPESIAILTILGHPIHQHRMSFHLVRSLISFNNV